VSEIPFDAQQLAAHREWVVRLARQLCRDEHTAEDSVQTVFARALERPPRHEGNVRAWLAALLRRAVGMHRRADERRERRERVVGQMRGGDHDEPAADAVARAEAHRRLVDRVLALPAPQRGLVLLHYFEDVPVDELARRFGMTAAAATGDATLSGAQTNDKGAARAEARYPLV
jgi:RNA polymerase sigma-70 factor (ECF subfamily)